MWFKILKHLYFTVTTLLFSNSWIKLSRSQIHTTLKRKSYENRAINPAAVMTRTTMSPMTPSPLSTNILSAKCNSADVTLNMLNAPQENNSGTDDIPSENSRHNFSCGVDIE